MDTKLNINSIPDGALTFDKIQLLDSSDNISLSWYLTEWKHNHSYTVSMDFNNITASDVEKIETVASRSKVGWIELHDTSSGKHYEGRLLYNDEYSIYNLCDLYIEPTDKTGCYYRIQRSDKYGPITFSIVYKTITFTTYDNLKWWRDNSMLTPGQQYRITDYITTTVQANTKSAGHQFDIIVTADSENTLNEKAKAVQHDGDTYFANSNLNAWEIWYSLDNDMHKFAWAQDMLLSPVSKRKLIMVKYYDDDVEDYETYIYVRYPEGDKTGTDYPCAWVEDNRGYGVSIKDYIRFNEEDFYTSSLIYTSTDTDVTTIFQDIYDEDGAEYIPVYATPETSGKGVIYHMIDEFGNDCPYDFKNIRFFKENGQTNLYIYTFNNRSNADNSMDGYSYGNVIKPYSSGGIMYINNIKFGYNCYNNTFGYNCHDNTFGNECSYNTFGNNCVYNRLGDNCEYIKFGTSTSVKNYYRNIVIDNGNRYIYLSCTATTSFNSYFQNVRIGLGVNTTTPYKTISSSETKQSYETLYRAENSKTLKPDGTSF